MYIRKMLTEDEVRSMKGPWSHLPTPADESVQTINEWCAGRNDGRDYDDLTTEQCGIYYLRWIDKQNQERVEREFFAANPGSRRRAPTVDFTKLPAQPTVWLHMLYYPQSEYTSLVRPFVPQSSPAPTPIFVEMKQRYYTQIGITADEIGGGPTLYTSLEDAHHTWTSVLIGMMVQRGSLISGLLTGMAEKPDVDRMSLRRYLGTLYDILLDKHEVTLARNFLEWGMRFDVVARYTTLKRLYEARGDEFEEPARQAQNYLWRVLGSCERNHRLQFSFPQHYAMPVYDGMVRWVSPSADPARVRWH